MSSVKPSTSAISFSNNKPFWDFAETTAFPVVINAGVKSPTVYVHLTPYTPEELKDILRKASAGYKREKRDIEIVREDRAIYTPLFDKHFVKMDNASGTPAQQRAWIDSKPQFKPAIIELSFGGVQMKDKATDTPEETTTDMLDISIELSGSYAVYQDIYDPISERVVRVDMTHTYSAPTEAQYREYRNARRNKFVRRTSLWMVTEQHSVLEKLYDAVIQSIDGAKVNDVFCTADKKEQWVGQVPLWHKLWIVDQIFGELVEKND